ncbi:MAG: agmatinase [Kiritimatiellae bacterium]|nr:agmatinase [Kiritimatiellia bacterium]
MSAQQRLFLDRNSAVQGDDSAPYAVLPVPYERTVSFAHGTARGPAAVLTASEQVELFDEELGCPFEFRVQTLPAPDCVTGGEPDVLARIRAAAAAVFSRRRFLLSIGGEHTVTVPLVEAARAVHADLTVLHVDAHADLRDVFRGNSLSHGCVARRVIELGARTVHVGLRSLSAEEAAFVRARNLPVYWAADICRAPDDAWMAAVTRHCSGAVYVSFDIDAFDPSLIPGTGTPEPGGLGWYSVTALLRRVFEQCRVVGADVVEVFPLPDSVASEFVAARLAAKMLAYHHHAAPRA